MAKKIFTGTVVSDKSDKTIVVKVNRSKRHPLYSKSFTVSKKIVAHDESNKAKIGDLVQIVESIPVSKTKSWQLHKVVGHAQTEEVKEPLKDEVIES